MTPNYINQKESLKHLRHRWRLTAFLFFFALWPVYLFLQRTWRPLYAQRWFIIAAGALVYQLWLLRQGLKHNHRQDETALLPTFGPGNALTLWRGVGLALLAGFLLSPWPPGGLAWLPALLYTLAAIADGFDGYLARRTNHATRLGEILDIEFDALGILVATALAVQYRQLPAWYLVLGLARYLFIWGIWWRRRQGKPVYQLPYSATRRIIAGFHMGFTTVMLWPIVYPPGTTLAGTVFAVPFLTGFIRDWLIVSGRINPASPAYLAIKQKLSLILTHHLPVLLRVLITVAALNLIIPVFKNSVAPVTLFIWIPLPFPQLTAWVITGIAIIATGMLVLGLAGRIAALALVIVASANIFSTGLYLDNGLMLSSTIAVMLVGTGAFSRWQPENGLLYRQTGNNSKYDCET